MLTSPSFEQLVAQARDTEKQTGDRQVVAYIEHLRATSAGLETLLNHKSDDPIRVLRKHWDEMAEVAAKLLKEIDNQQRTREEALQKPSNTPAIHERRRLSPTPDRALPETATPQVAPGTTDFAAIGKQLKALQRENERKIDDLGSRTHQWGSELRRRLLAPVSAVRADASRLRWVLRRMKLTRLASVAVRALLGVLTFLALYALLLWLHHPIAEFAQGLIQGTWSAFGLLAALLLPIELLKAFLVEPTVHSWLHKWERIRTRDEFDKLITLLAQTRFAIARANA